MAQIAGAVNAVAKVAVGINEVSGALKQHAEGGEG